MLSRLLIRLLGTSMTVWTLTILILKAWSNKFIKTVSSEIHDKRYDFDFDIEKLAVLLMVYTFRNLLGLLESAIMLRTSMRETNV